MIRPGDPRLQFIQQKTYELLLIELNRLCPLPRELVDLGSGDAVWARSFEEFKTRGVRTLHLVDPMLRVAGSIKRPVLIEHSHYKSVPVGKPVISSHPGFTILPDDQAAWWVRHANAKSVSVPTWEETLDWLRPPVLAWCSFSPEEAAQEADQLASWGYTLVRVVCPAESRDWILLDTPSLRFGFCDTISVARLNPTPGRTAG